MSKPWLLKLEEKITRISDAEYRPAPFSFEQLLVGGSKLYEAIVDLRHLLYRSGLLKQKHLPCFVISIGNIVAGGAGKTPMAVYMAELLLEIGVKPVVVSRGYKGVLNADAAVVGDGKDVFLDAKRAGDEPHMMASRKSFGVVVGKDRYRAGRLALEKLNPEVLILDDGFQHLRLARDLDILLFDHDRPLGNGRLLPAGRLRETLSKAGARAHAVVLTRCPGGDRAGSIEKKKGPCPYLPVFKTRHLPFLLWQIPGSKRVWGNSDTPESLAGRKGFLFSGIAKNSSFRESVEELGVKVMDHLEFKDHYRYKMVDFKMIQKAAQASGADLILTTEKDWTKLPPEFDWGVDLAVIGIRLEIFGDKGFKTFIRSKLQ